MGIRRWCAALGLLAVLAGCADPVSRTPAPPYDAVPAGVVVLELLDMRTTHADAVLGDRHDVIAFAGRLVTYDPEAAGTLREQADTHDFGATTLLAFLSGVGCDVPQDAQLTRARGGSDFTFRFRDVTEYDNCTEPKGSLVVFALPKEDVPPDVTLGGYPPRPPGAGRLVEFVPLGTRSPAPEVLAAEVSQPDQAQRFLAQFPDQLPSHRSGWERPYEGRLFAFVLPGCPEEEAVALVVEPERLAAEPTEGRRPDCGPDEYVLAVFALDAGDVPPQARIGGT
ncbi:hypothetical protein [Pseudonocardia zijingensis]|uniref:Lipoprotein n=1 Tax=Pseudonocardia zijingensis TaxID=153376 RepID=A0ABP3YXW2_9PSEU